MGTRAAFVCRVVGDLRILRTWIRLQGMVVEVVVVGGGCWLGLRIKGVFSQKRTSLLFLLVFAFDAYVFHMYSIPLFLFMEYFTPLFFTFFS